MSEWIEPIIDRTQADVDFAIAKIQEWKLNNNSDVYDLKGCFNVSDINRIENNIRYLSEKLTEYYYFTYTTNHRIWDKEDVLYDGDIQIIINNVETILSSYLFAGAPPLPESLLTFDQVNLLESNLYELKRTLDSMILSFRECGTFRCGEV